jgi:hypothetical protein
MKNATIATSRTRASADHVITYRPLPETWGDVDSLRAVRARKARAAARGTDPSTLEISASHEAPVRVAEHERTPQRTVPAGRHRARPSFPALLSPMLGMLRSA